MPNTKYAELKQLLDSNPDYKMMLNAISKAEGTYGKDSYSTKYGGKKIDWRNGKDRTVGKNNSAAHGKYQFNNDTWDEVSKELGLTGFSPEEQDVAALLLLEKTKALDSIQKGNFKEAIFKASQRWAGLPADESGKSFHKYSGTNKRQPAKPLATVMSYMRDNNQNFEAKNKELEKLNKVNLKNYSPEKKAEVFKNYETQLDEINKSNLLPGEKNAQRQSLKKKLWMSGDFGFVNQKLLDNYKEGQKIIESLKKLDITNLEENKKATGLPLAPEEQKRNNRNREINYQSDNKATTDKIKKYEYLKNKATELGIFMPNYSTLKKAGGLDPEKLQGIIGKVEKLNINRVEPNQSKYNYTKEEYDAQFQQENQDLEEDYSPIVNVVESTATTETATEKADRLKAEAMQKASADAVEAEKMKPFSGSPILDKINQQSEFSDPKFKYTPGKQQIPFDALTGLASGLIGAASADSVDIQYRDEQISQGLLQYAEDIAKIKNIGLTPTEEADLKMKLADAYQTGLDNIVQASNGNRNLVLGNQGQLDKSRMAGIVQIATLDNGKREKAMEVFGQLQEYIDKFESSKSIANNERKYAEDQLKRSTGANTAAQGMSAFIDGIRDAKENAPGSVNDIARQLFQFNTTGILKDAKEGEPGHPGYIEIMKTKQKEKEQKLGTYSQWIKGKTLNEQDIITNILTKNPNLDPTKNDESNFDELKKMYDSVSGTDEYKSYYQQSKNHGSAVVNKVEAEAAKVAEPTKPVVQKERQTLETIDSKIKTVGLAQTKNATPVSNTIVTNKNINENTLTGLIAQEINGGPSGVNALNQGASTNKNEAGINLAPLSKRSILDNNLTPTDRGEILDQKATEYLNSTQKSNAIIERITQDAEQFVRTN
jgi:muramidase (phage lysozyme)